MLLAVDIGNTHTVIGVFKNSDIAEKFRFTTNPNDTADEVSLKVRGLLSECGLGKEDITDVIIACVVPPILLPYCEMARSVFNVKPVSVGPGVKTGMKILYDNPREVGADRIANAVGGYSLFGGPLIIVDLGTAITFDAISEKGEYIGGVIAPGINTSMASLFKKAAQLPQISLEEPSRVIGKNTIESMQSGAVYGFCGMADSIVKKMKKEMGGDPKVVVTGGQSDWLLDLSETIDETAPDLTLIGLYKIHLLQK